MTLSKIKMSKKIILTSIIVFCFSIQILPQPADSVLQKVSGWKDDSVKYNYIDSVAWEQRRINPDLSIVLSDYAILLAEKIKYKYGVATSYFTLATAYQYKGDFSGALELFFIALDIYNELGNKEDVAWTYNEIGIILRNQGVFTAALNYYNQALIIFDELGFEDAVAVCYTNIGNIHLNQESYDDALNYFEKSREICEKSNNKEYLAIIYNNIGEIYNKKGEFRSAYDYFLKAYQMNTELNNKPESASNYVNLAINYSSQKEYKKAIEFFRNAITIYEEINAKPELASSFLLLGECYLNLGDYRNAFRYMTKSEKLADAMGANITLMNAYQKLALIYRKINSFRKAFEYQSKYIAVKDSVFKSDKITELGKLEAKFTFERLLNQRERAEEMRQRILEEQKRYRNTLHYLGIALLVIISFLLLLAGKKYKVSLKTANALLFIFILLLFQFISILKGPYVGRLTVSVPAYELIANIISALLLMPVNKFLQKFLEKKFIQD